jgi:hypothetical protein
MRWVCRKCAYDCFPKEAVCPNCGETDPSVPIIEHRLESLKKLLERVRDFLLLFVGYRG